MSDLLLGRLLARKNTILAGTVALSWWILGGTYMFADDTWIGADPTSNLWTHPANWSNNAPPANTENTLFFLGPGQTTNVQNDASSGEMVNNLFFPGVAPAFTIQIKSMQLLGLGIINQSGVAQTLEMIPSALGPFLGGQLSFHNSATAGSATLVNDSAINSTTGADGGGATTFINSSSGGTATINNNAAQAIRTGVGRTFFKDSSSADGATINNFGGGGSGFAGASTEFSGSSSGGTSTIVNGAAPPNGDIAGGDGGTTRFDGSSHAGSATIINEGSAAINLSFGAAGFTNFTSLSSAENATIINDPGQTEAGLTQFDTKATAANATINNNGGDTSSTHGGETRLLTSAFAANATINNNASTASAASGGLTTFDGGSADSATINNNGGVASSQGGQTEFLAGTAGNATIINNGGGLDFGQGGKTIFSGSSDPGNATLIGNAGVPTVSEGRFIIPGGLGGSILFNESSTGGTSRVEVFGNGGVDISGHASPGVTIGSLEGSGNAFLGAHNLTVGSNNRSTNFSGIARNGGASGGTGGSLTKIGTGTLTLSHPNTYTGGTTIKKGALVVDNTTGSATGPGAVHVNLGTLRGVGQINGAVTVGTGSSSGAIFLAGNSVTNPGTLTINSALTFESMSTYKCVLKRSMSSTGVTAVAGKVSARGVIINSGVPFTFTDTGTGILPIGTVFTVINNTSASPISGRFSNLPNGSTFTSNGNTFKVNYAGGTGNDLTLKVVE